MKEYGGYIEFENYHGMILHEETLALNSGRGALEYLCEAKKIKKLYLPYFLCSSVPNLCKKIELSIATIISTKSLSRFSIRYLVKRNGYIL